MKIEVGMYVRFKEDSGADNLIDKIVEIDFNASFQYACTRPLVYLEKNDCIYLDELKQAIKGKPSYNIIDLIEDKDFCEIEFYSPRYEKRITRVFQVDYIVENNICFER